MLPLIQRDIVERNKWLTEEEFLDMFAVAQSLPGVFAVNMSTFIGFRKKGLAGGVAASLGATLPSFVIILVRDNAVVDAVMKGIRPAVVAMIAIPVITIWKAMRMKTYMLVIPIVVAIAVWYFNFSPVWVILISGVAGIGYMLLKSTIEAKRIVQSDSKKRTGGKQSL